MPSGVGKLGPSEDQLARDTRFFQNPWGEPTQKLRSQLLVVSLIGIVMAAAGIVPSEVSALGLKVTDVNQKALLIVLAVVTVYLILAFAFYAYSDLMGAFWRYLHTITATGPLTLREEEDLAEAERRQRKLSWRLKHIHEARLLFDVACPLIAGKTSVRMACMESDTDQWLKRRLRISWLRR
jgi:hypothetical protein